MRRTDVSFQQCAAVLLHGGSTDAAAADVAARTVALQAMGMRVIGWVRTRRRMPCLGRVHGIISGSQFS